MRFKLHYVHIYSTTLGILTAISAAVDIYLLSKCFEPGIRIKHFQEYKKRIDHAYNFWTLSYGSIFLLLVISLFVSNYFLNKVLNKYTTTDSYKKVLKQTCLIFTISYGCRSIYLGLSRTEPWKSVFVSSMVHGFSFLLWDFPPVISMLCLNLNSLKKTKKQQTLLEDRKSMISQMTTTDYTNTCDSRSVRFNSKRLSSGDFVF